MAARLRARLRFLTWGMLRFLLIHSVTNGKNEKGVPANFFVYYEIDDEESKHALALDEFGHQEVANAWVLLDEDDGAAAE